MLKKGPGWLGRSPVLAQRAASEVTRWTRAVGIIPATPYGVKARCGLARGTARLGAPGWVGEMSGLFEHPAYGLLLFKTCRLMKFLRVYGAFS
jgi:hypothetical protein